MSGKEIQEAPRYQLFGLGLVQTNIEASEWHTADATERRTPLGCSAEGSFLSASAAGVIAISSSMRQQLLHLTGATTGQTRRLVDSFVVHLSHRDLGAMLRRAAPRCSPTGSVRPVLRSSRPPLRKLSSIPPTSSEIDTNYALNIPLSRSLAAKSLKPIMPRTVLPPPPVDGLYRRPLPKHLIAFSSPEGKQLFREALSQVHSCAHYIIKCSTFCAGLYGRLFCARRAIPYAAGSCLCASLCVHCEHVCLCRYQIADLRP